MKRQQFSHRLLTAMTLLEVIISIALLGVLLAIISESARMSFQNARIAREQLQAELLAQSVLAKIQLGIIEMEPAFEVPIGLGSIHPADIVRDTHAISSGTAHVPWVYSVEINPVRGLGIDDHEFLVELAITVRQAVSEGQRPVVCRLVRWLAIELEQEEYEEE